MILYRLSNRQQKELRVRGASIRIAVPVPFDAIETIDDATDEQLRRLFVELVANIPLDHVRAIELTDLSVRPSRATTMNGYLGEITNNPNCDWIIPITAIVATLCEFPRPRARQHDIQWPGSVRAGELVYPPPHGTSADSPDAE